MKKLISINVDHFVASNKAPYDVFIRFGKNFVELAASNTQHNKIHAVSTYKKELGNITAIEASTIFETKIVKGASRTYIGLESIKYTLVPNVVYSEKEKDNYLKTLYDLEPNENIISQHIIPEGCTSVFTIKKETQDLLLKKLGQVEIFHTPSALLLAYQQLIPPNKKLVSFVRLKDKEILLTFYKSKKLLLHQSYEITTLEDAIYYYLYAIETLKLDASQMNLSVLGRSSKLEEFKTAVQGNIAYVKYANRLPTLQYTDQVFSQNAHDFFNLFSLLLCA